MTSVLMSVLAMLGGVERSRAALHLEVLALRHRLHLLQRSRPRGLRLGKADRWLWARLSPAWSRLANGTRDREAGDGHRLASARPPDVLEVEESPTSTSAADRRRRAECEAEEQERRS